MKCLFAHHSQRPAAFQGFTLIELLVVIALLGILAAFAAPSLQIYLERSRLRSYTNELVASLQYAKAEALARGGDVHFCPNLGDATSPQCTSTVIKLPPTFVGCGQDFFTDGWKITTSTTVLRAITRPAPNGMSTCLNGNSADTHSIDLDHLGRPSRPYVSFSVLGNTLCRRIRLYSTGLIELVTEDKTHLGDITCLLN